MCEAVALALAAALSTASPAAAVPVQPASAVAAPITVAGEPMYADIIARARGLKARVEHYRRPGLAASGAAATLPELDPFRAQVGQLADLDMKGHLDLKARGVDGDLKCILKGISEDLPKRLSDLDAAKTGAEQDTALREMAYLLNDNVEVLTSPPKPPV
ncbi:MAG TPA: hypothetical protein VF559_06830 [Caulobacteraceae bacterium]